MKTENTIAKILKFGSIFLFVIAVAGSIMLSYVETTDYSNLYDDYKYDDDDYDYSDDGYDYSDDDYSDDEKSETTTEFDSSIFVRYLFESTIACTLIFAFGELIEQTSQTRKHVEEMERVLNGKTAHDILEDK